MNELYSADIPMEDEPKESLKKKRFFIFGHYGWKNTGDDAMLYALIQELCIRFPQAEFVVFSWSHTVLPFCAKDKIRFVKRAPIPVLWEIVKSFVKSSTFIVGGGTIIHDYGNRIRNAIALIEFFILLLIVKFARNKIYLAGVGIGPISTAWGRTMTRLICCLASHITVRDKISYEILEMLGLANKAELCFDLAAILAPLRRKGIKRDVNTKILGISVTPVFELYYGNKEKDVLIINEIAKHLNQWLNTMPQLQVYLFIFKDKPRNDDVRVTKLLKEQLQPSERVRIIPYNSDPIKTLDRIAQCSAFIGMKYHSCLFAYLSNIPLLVIDYHPKCRALAEEIGLPEQAIISLPEIMNGHLIKRLKNLVESPKDFCATMPVELAKERGRMAFGQMVN